MIFMKISMLGCLCGNLFNVGKYVKNVDFTMTKDFVFGLKFSQ